MPEFAVWAPSAARLRVNVDGSIYEMQGPDERGWWKAQVAAGAPGSAYGFLVGEDSKLYPDPRSAWQPEGPHAASRVYDHNAFRWTDTSWQAQSLGSAILYELHVGTFTPEGTFNAAIAHLSYLRELGITHMELMPLAEFPGRFGWGYDGASLFAVREAYGGPDGLKRLVDAAHAQGIGVLIDVVYNHFGPVGNYTGIFGPYLTSQHRTPWGDAVNFDDSGSAEVRRFFCDNALMWMREFHVDGLRLDAVHEFVDQSDLHFMEQLAIEVEALSKLQGRPIVLIAESDLNDSNVVAARAVNGYGIDAQWSDDFHHSLFAVLHAKERTGYYGDFGAMGDLAKSLKEAFVYQGQFSKYRQRLHGRPMDRVGAHSFVGYIQNHDQVGNRALGDRLEQTVGFARAKVAAGILLTAPFIPMLFQGEEFAASTPFQYFADYDDADMSRSVSEGRRREFAAFGWDPAMIPDPEEVATFERSKLQWQEQRDGHHAEMLTWYRELIAFRKHTPSLNVGDLSMLTVAFNEEKLWLKMQRGNVVIAFNLGIEAHEVTVPADAKLALASGADVTVVDSLLTVPPERIAILQLA